MVERGTEPWVPRPAHGGTPREKATGRRFQVPYLPGAYARPMAKIPAIQQTFYLAVPPNRVFAALTRPRQLAKWFLEKATITPKPGSTFEFTWRGGYSMKGKVEGVSAPRRLELEWVDRFDGDRTLRTRVRFALRKRGKGTLLTVTHRGFKSGKKWVLLYGGVQSGWAYYLTNLKSVLEHGFDLRSRLDSLG